MISYTKSPSDPDTDEDPDKDFEPQKKKFKSLVDDSLASAADRSNLSDRQLLMMLPHVPGVREKIEKKEFSFSRSTIKRSRKKSRKMIADRIRENFAPQTPQTVHWDGKIMENFFKLDKVNRLSISVTGGGAEKLLEIVKCESGKGEEEAEHVFAVLKKWTLIDRVKAMCFDTTASNTGVHTGACVLLEKKMKKKLHYFACRHHVLELTPTAIYEKIYEATSGPDPQLFKQFQYAWSSIDKTKFVSGMDDPEMKPFLMQIRKDTVKFCKDQLLNFQPRDDYKEILELPLLILGEKLEKVLSEFNLNKISPRKKMNKKPLINPRTQNFYTCLDNKKMHFTTSSDVWFDTQRKFGSFPIRLKFQNYFSVEASKEHKKHQILKWGTF